MLKLCYHNVNNMHTEFLLIRLITAAVFFILVFMSLYFFQPMQISILFTFLARQMARHDNTIFVNRVLFEQVIYL